MKRLQTWADEAEMTRTDAVRLFIEYGLERQPKLKPK
jgi:hypothetical protein